LEGQQRPGEVRLIFELLLCVPEEPGLVIEVEAFRVPGDDLVSRLVCEDEPLPSDRLRQIDEGGVSPIQVRVGTSINRAI
jgi:hypothetical protein